MLKTGIQNPAIRYFISRVRHSNGLMRTGDTISFANCIIESAWARAIAAVFRGRRAFGSPPA